MMNSRHIRSGLAGRGEIIKAAIDPFNAGDDERDELRSCPPDWRVIDGGQRPFRLSWRQIEQRRRQIDLVRRHYDPAAATRLERQLAADLAKDLAAVTINGGRR